MEKQINLLIYSNNDIVGNLKILRQEKSGKEIYYFNYSENWLKNNTSFSLMPNLPLTKEVFFFDELPIFLNDLMPDRWGRMLIKRKIEQDIINNRKTNKYNHIFPSTYLLEVSDFSRIGSLRICLHNNFLATHNFVPKLEQLNNLLLPAKYIEEKDKLKSKKDNIDKYLKDLFLSGSSLGGAHPKASIIDNNNLYIAKFDIKNNGIATYEYLCNQIAKKCGINAVEMKLLNAINKNDVVISKRFDRDNNGKVRIPYMSAMTLLGLKDGEDSYLKNYLSIIENAKEFLSIEKETSIEMWKRMVVNILLGNTDDHLRNHAFIKKDNKWVLSPAYDITPSLLIQEIRNHSLSVYENGSTKPFYMLCDAIEYSQFFDVDKKEAIEYIEKSLKIIDEFNYSFLEKKEYKTIKQYIIDENKVFKEIILKNKKVIGIERKNKIKPK